MWITERRNTMKLSCLQENLNKGLQIVSRLTKTGGSLPILANVLLKTEKGRLKLSATDLEIGINHFIGAKIDKEGAISVPARIFIDYISIISDKKVNLSLQTDTLFIESEKHKAKIKGLPASDFPLIPEVKPKDTLSLDALMVKEAINQVLIAPSLDETKPVLSGICLKLEGKKMKMVATDSFRLSEKTINLDKEMTKTEIIIPARTLQEVYRIIGLTEPNILTLNISENQASFILNGTELVSRLIEGSFPEYESIIPKNTETTTKLNVGEFQNALKLANLFAKETGGTINLKIQKNNITVSSQATLVGEDVSTIPASSEGPEVEISFNAKFLLDVLGVVTSSEIILGVTGKYTPAIIKPSNKDDFIYLLMPLKEG